MSLYLPFNFGSRSLESKAQAFYYTGADQTFNFIGGQTYTIYAWGAAGGYNNFNGNQNFGGYGAYLTGVFSPSTSGIATVIVGRAGQGSINQVSNVGHWYGGGGAGNGIAADGGGRASIFVNTTDILTVGGGGGSGGNMAAGAAPGGNAGAAYSNGVFTSTGSKPSGNWAGYGATMSAGGKYGDGGTSSGSSGTGPAGNTGSTQIGGDGSGNAGGGGSGYYGGGGSSTDYYNGSSGGGGGSSYINTNYFSCISAAQGSSIPTSTSLSGAVKGLYNGAGYTAGTSSSSNNGHGLIIIVQNPLTFNPTYLPGCMLWLDAADVDGTGVTTTSTVLSLASFVPASPTTQEVSYSVSSQYYYSLSNWTPVSCVMNGPSVNGSQPQTANLAPSATTGIWYGYWNDGTYCKMVKLQFSITSGRIYVTALSAGYVSSASSITSSTTGTQNDTIFSSATSATVATSSTTGAYGVQSFSIKTSGLPSNGTNITTWVDKSGNGNNASPSNGSSGVIPTYSNSAVFINNGGSANYNSSTYTCLNISSNFQTGTNFSIFAVFNFTNSNGYQSIFQNQRPNGQTENRIQLGNTQTFDTDSSGNVRAITGISLGTSTSVVSYLTSQAANYMYQNSVLIGSNTTAITEVSTDGNALPSIGGGNSDNRWATGYFNEIICYNGLLTSAQRRQVETYLAWKWGLPTPLGTFSPFNVGNPVLWLDAADTSTLLLSGSNVTQWNDKSGNGRNFYQATGSNQPTLSNSVVNSLPSVTFTVSQNMTSSSFVLSASNKSTLFFVVQETSLANTGNSSVFNSSDNTKLVLFNRTSATNNITWGYNGYSYETNINSVVTPALYVISATSSTSNFYYNGTFNSTATPTNSATVATSDTYRVGGGWIGYVSEVIFFNNQLTTIQQQQVEGYLAWKWGLQGNLPSSHIYKSISPSEVSPQVTYSNATVDNTIYSYTFTSSGSITFAQSVTAGILVVAGGGGGGAFQAGGGGGGGVIINTVTIPAGTYTITVGTGGSGGVFDSSRGGNGGNSSIGSLYVAIGGGGGGNVYNGGSGNQNGITGGSGGGGGAWNGGGTSGGSGTSGQGNAGAGSSSSGYAAGGGGGAGAAGGVGNSNIGGAGGIGLPCSLSGTLTYYGGGGSAGTNASTRTAGSTGGGGAGGNNGSLSPVSGTPNTGGGGGGGGLNAASNGAAGGSGIIIIKIY